MEDLNNKSTGTIILTQVEKLKMINKISQVESALTLITSDCEGGRFISDAETISNVAYLSRDVLSDIKKQLSEN